jgi:hypothetical protein
MCYQCFMVYCYAVVDRVHISLMYLTSNKVIYIELLLNIRQ